MITLKGYNTDVWGAEIYQKDNRYGRYQSYGAVLIMGNGHPVSRKGSGFKKKDGTGIACLVQPPSIFHLNC